MYRVLAPARAQVDAAFARLKSIDQQVGQDLQFTDEGLAKRGRSSATVPLVAAEWKELADAAASAHGQIMPASYAPVVRDLRAMISQAGDESNLAVDPQLDSNYLVDVTLQTLPEAQDRLAREILLGRHVITQQSEETIAEGVELRINAQNLQDADYSAGVEKFGPLLERKCQRRSGKPIISKRDDAGARRVQVSNRTVPRADQTDW